ncbi:endonuclease [Mesoflavibacter zeaxanthinifaciens]|uniref:endonuclease n=1 Tax=Mesoflavibacter zeaxanthinifaciens TaxID=393060 RepID=UPI000420C19A|nr:endonuclease [Mesoflavibacter zeaxanthinifaciens]
MKQIYILIALLITSFGFAQVPAGYYSTATGTGYTLKTQLKVIITNGHTWNSNSYDNLYQEYALTDTDNYYENDGSVLDIYTEKPSQSDTYNYNHSISDQCGGSYNAEGQCYNREHLFPQGFFNNSENLPMVSDIHHVIPTDGFVNNGRSNYPFGVVTSTNTSYSNGSKWGTGNNYGYTGRCFEPIDEFKGYVARAMLYFAVRYEDNWDDSGWDPHTVQYNPLNGTSDQFYETWFINTMLDWHNTYPPSQFEIDRNDAAYLSQGNRNPFVDNPAYANLIWNPSTDTTAPTTPTNLVASNATASTIGLSWTASTDDVAVASYDIFVDGSFYTNTSTAVTNFTVTGLTSETNYCFTIYALDAAGNTSNVSNQDCEMTTNVPAGINEIFFSEYIEGSGNNKALEIANYTNSTVQLANYTLRLGSNGNSFGSDVSFPSGASIAAGDVYVIVNSGLSLGCESEADYTNNTITGFNGNDAIGLFKNGTLIDIIGEEGNSSTFAQNTTLVRKSTITNPTTSFSLSEWDSYLQDTCDSLGQPTLSTSNFEKSTFKIYPNPIKGNTLNADVKSTTSYQIYDILGKKILSGTVTTNNKKINVSSLKKGIYILKLETSNGSVTKKLIRE